MSPPRINALELLDPAFREPADAVIADLAQANIPLHPFETIRSPHRQNELFARGRDPSAPDYGRTVTKARAYQSAHQYGMGLDMVFRIGSRWTWDEPSRGLWNRFHAIAIQRGLEPLSFEKPHIQLRDFDWKLLQRGPDDEGDWLAWLARGRR